jgi:hypothetical protein
MACGAEYSDLKEGVDEGWGSPLKLADGLEGSFLSGPPNPEGSIHVFGGENVLLFPLGKDASQETIVPGLPGVSGVGEINDIIAQMPMGRSAGQERAHGGRGVVFFCHPAIMSRLGQGRNAEENRIFAPSS